MDREIGKSQFEGTISQLDSSRGIVNGQFEFYCRTYQQLLEGVSEYENERERAIE